MTRATRSFPLSFLACAQELPRPRIHATEFCRDAAGIVGAHQLLAISRDYRAIRLQAPLRRSIIIAFP